MSDWKNEPESPDAQPPADESYSWLTDAIEPTAEAPRSWAEQIVEPDSGTPLHWAPSARSPVERAVAASPPVVPSAAEVAPEPAGEVAPAAEAVPEPEPAPPAPPPVIHPPVPASELPPIPQEEEKKTSLLKREITFGRKPKADKPKKEPKAKAPRAKAEKQPKAEKPPKAEKQPKPEKPPKAEKPKRDRTVKQPRAKGQRPSGAHKKLVGLKIGASQLAAARVVNNGNAQVVQLAREELEPGIVVAGELRDPDALAEALKSFFRKNKLPKRGVRLGIANNRIGVRTFDLSGIDDPKQLTNAIRFRAQEALPIPIDEAVLDYQVLGESVDEQGERSRRILLVVAYRELIDRYVAACRKAGIQLVGIDLEAFALLRALAEPIDPEVEPDAALVAVSIGHDRSTFAVSNGRVCEFTRVLDWGGATLNVAVARALDIAPSEAEPIKCALSVDGDEVPEGVSAAAAAKAREAIGREIQAFARELVSSLQFYQSQPGSLGIGRIAITGGTAHLPGLPERLQQLIGVGVDMADPLGRVSVGKRVRDHERLGSLAVAIGLGIED